MDDLTNLLTNPRKVKEIGEKKYLKASIFISLTRIEDKFSLFSFAACCKTTKPLVRDLRHLVGNK